MLNNEKLDQWFEYLQSHVIGQNHLMNRLVMALLADGHLLVEGAPGLAKTKAIRTLSMTIECDFQRIQFTPDLLPSDLTGTDVYNQKTGLFELHKGPLFHNFILADEINRAPAKVQSALLEAMAEKQITVGQKTIPLARMFLVMATQNPIEQAGTYALPEAQLDRFLMKVNIDYPSAKHEHEILLSHDDHGDYIKPFEEKITQLDLFETREKIASIDMPEAVRNYIVQLVMATRKPKEYLTGDIVHWIEYGVSPRGSIALSKCAKTHAFLNNKTFVSPEDVQNVLKDVLNHRILLSYEAQSENITTQDVINDLLKQVPAY